MKKKNVLVTFLVSVAVMIMIPLTVLAQDTNAVAQIGNSTYQSLSEAVEEAGKDDTIILLTDITDVSTIKIDKNITINLNSHKIGFAKNSYFFVQGGTLNLEGEGMAYEQHPYYSPVLVKGMKKGESNTKVSVGSGVTLQGWSGLFVNQNGNDNYGIEINVYGTLYSVNDINGDGGHTLYVNGTIKENTGNVKITLDGAKLLNKEGGNGMYLAGYADTTIKNSIIESSAEGSTGIEIRAGNLEISNSSIIGGNGEFEYIPNGNGSTSANVALAIVQHTTKQSLSVKVNEGTILTGSMALAQANPQKNNEEAIDKITVLVNGGVFHGDIYAENLEEFIKKATFDKAVDQKYLASDAVVHTHSYSDKWTVDDNEHWNQCECGSRINVSAHSFTWIVDKEATEEEAGAKHEECTVCGYKRATVVIPATADPEEPSADNINPPKTGDNSNTALWSLLAAVSVAGLGVLLLRRKKYPVGK